MLRFHREILNEFRRLRNAKVYVYGSVARGNYRLDSDIDLAIVTNDNKVKKLAEEIADKVLIKYGKVVSLKFITPKRFNSCDPFIEEVKKGRRFV